MHYQQRVERLAYLATGRSYEAPLQWARDFLAGRQSRGKIPTSYRRGGQGIDLGVFLPELVIDALVNGLPKMDRRFGGRFLRDATLTGPESRGSSPVRIIREPESRESPGISRALSLRRRGRLRGRNHQCGRRWPAHGAGDCRQVCECRANSDNRATRLRGPGVAHGRRPCVIAFHHRAERGSAS